MRSLSPTLLVLVGSLAAPCGVQAPWFSLAAHPTPHPAPTLEAVNPRQTEHPADVILRAIRVFEGDSTEVVRRAWSRLAAGPAGDPEAFLGLMTLSSLDYDFPAEEEWFGVLRDLAGTRDVFVAAGWLQFGESLAGRGEYHRADSAYSNALAVARDLGDSRISTWALLGLARVRYRLVGSNEARRLQAEAELRIPLDDLYLQSRLRCARAASIEEVEVGAALALQAGIRRMQAACLHIAANLHINRGETGRAAYLLVDVERIQRQIGDRGGRAATLQWLGYNLRINNDLEAARMFLAEAVRDGIASQSHAPVAWAYLNLGQVRLMVGDRTEALAYADSAEGLFRQQGDQWGMATLLETRGLASTLTGDFGRARQALQEALRLYRELRNGPGIFGANTGLYNLALAEDDLDEAARLLAANRATVERFGMAGWERSLLFEEADLAKSRGDHRRAKLALQEILEAPEHPRRIYAAKVRMAEVLALEGAIDEAVSVLRDALSRLDRWRREASLPELKRFAFQTVGRSTDPDLGVATVISAIASAGKAPEAFEIAEAQRARELFDRLVRERLVRPVSIDSILANPPTIEESRTDSLPDWTPAIRATDLQRALPDENTALLEYVVGLGNEPTTALVLTRSSVNAYQLPPIDSLGPVISRLRVLAESGEDIRGVASDLGNKLIGPVVRSLGPGIERIVIVPDGALHGVPFDALQVEDGRFLVQAYTLSLAPSAAVAAHLWAQTPSETSPRILALGDPVFADASDPSTQSGPLRQAFMETGGLGRLEGSGEEVRAISRFGNRAEVRLRDAASEAYLKFSDLTPFRVIHLATHALVSEGAVGRTALALAPDTAEDGFLAPSDLAELSLDADVVVLSACQTAGGVFVRGEGIQGLTGPLLQAGARSVLATTWRLEDRATLGILDGFYEGLADGLSAGGALRAAKITAIERGSPAAEWGAFVLVGDPTVEVPLRRPRKLPIPLIWASILLMVTLGGYLGLRYRSKAP